MGVRTLKVLSEIPVKLLEREFGESGKTILEHANAIDNRPRCHTTKLNPSLKNRLWKNDTLDMAKDQTEESSCGWQ